MANSVIAPAAAATTTTTTTGSDVNKIKYIIDMDGFMVDCKFRTKEFAIGCMLDLKTQLYYFKVGSYYDVPIEQRFQIKWVRKYIHGLYFHDYPGDLEPHTLPTIILLICQVCELNNWLIGYKGGHHEYDILKSLGYAHLGYNLELIGCPKIEKLIKDPRISVHTMKIDDTCNRHSMIMAQHKKNYISAHCPKVEVEYFMAYLKSLDI